MDIYQRSVEKYQEATVKLVKDLQELSWSRLMVFIFSAFFIVLLARAGSIIVVLMLILLGGIAFAAVMKKYNKVAFQKQHATFLAEINEQEILRLQNNLSHNPNGQKYVQREHPYVADLDVFGLHSLFQLLNRTTTESGNDCLAEWLSKSASQDVILERQQAVEELALQIEWRQDFQASGMHFANVKSNYQTLLAWLENPVRLLPHQTKYLIAAVILALLSTLAFVYHLLFAYASDFVVNTLPLIAILVINAVLLKRTRPIAEEIIHSTHHNVKTLGGYQSLIRKIESEKFHAKRLQQLQTVFNQSNYSAAREINTLKRILDVAQQKGTTGTFSNQAYTMANIFWLIDIYWIILAEQWKTRNSSYLKKWADAVGEFEALSSLAGFSYSNPDYTFPQIKGGACTIHFDRLGHPLLKSESRVCNDFDFRSSDNIVMITGSNMAGKSTFLRTVGVNLVLALMGAPCCANAGELTGMTLFSSMRTQDNLEEGISSFNAELRKIEQLLNLIQNREPVFFLLDEMFKGTNSKDRHWGGFSLIKQLKQLNAFGMISTHDLELADLAGQHKLVTNYSFNSEIQEGEMTFDYRLTPDLCKDFNASELMRRSGIKILPQSNLL